MAGGAAIDLHAVSARASAGAPQPIRASNRRGTLVAVLLVLGGLTLLSDTFGGGPQGSPSSSYSTGSAGLAAWAELLARSGHDVTQLRVPLARATLDPRAALVVLDPDALLRSEGERLRAYVRAGGLLVIGAADPGATLPALLADPPDWSTSGSGAYRPAADSRGTAFGRLGVVETARVGEWTSMGADRRLLGSASGALLLREDLGLGAIELLADPSPVQNRLLAYADNAALALALVGGAGRPVTFVESVHGYGPDGGLARFRLAGGWPSSAWRWRG